MRSMAFKGAALMAIGLTVAACSSSQPEAQPSAATSTTAPALAMSRTAVPASSNTRTGTFQGLNEKHVGGTVTVSDGQVTLSGFSSDEGPDLHIYLASGSDEAAVAAGKELGSVAFDKASQTFSAGAGDVSTYTTVVIHCDKAKAVFGAATLT